MVTTESIPLNELAEARLTVYRFLLAALDKPTPQQHDWFTSHEFVCGLEDLCEQFGVAPLRVEPTAADPAEHEARYIACFEVGLPTPPVVLLASHYNRREPVTAIIHEHILFYQCFGAHLAAGNIEPADHLLTELAFLIRLDELLLKGLSDVGSIVRARRDFLHRQVARWPVRAAETAVEKHLPEVYCTLLTLVASIVAQDLALTEAAVADSGGEES